MKKFILVVCLIGIFFFLTEVAESAYVLPYPSYLPGNKLYKVSELIDGIKKYWHFGTLTQLKYVQEMSDKHLVEAKTLFEYKQYALGVMALEKSNGEVSKMPQILMKLQNERKNNADVIKKVKEEMSVHAKVLTRMFSEVPDSIDWTEERERSRVINFSKLFKDAADLRKTVLSN